jgi:NADPH2:quinone reductase
MLAIRHHTFGTADILQLDELPTPDPRDNEVLVRVSAAAVNHFDILSRNGIIPEMPLPRIVGIDCSGVVERYSGTRTDIRQGTPVVILGERMGNGRGQHRPGAYATHVCIHEEEVFPVPEGIDMTAVACLGISYLTAWYALTRRYKLQAGETLLIQGIGGGVASAAFQIAQALGANVIATTSTESKRLRALELGAVAAFNYRNDDVPTVVRDMTDGKGVDAVLNAVGGKTIQEGLQCLRNDGTLLTIGTAYGREFAFDGFDFLLRELNLIGVDISPHTPHERYAYMLELMELIQQKKMTVLVDREYPLSDAANAHQYVESHEQFGKVVLLPHTPHPTP